VHDGADAGAEALTGEFDFVQSLRALVNLIENALKYSPSDTTVELGAVRRGTRLEFRVADRGPGVIASERQRVFEPFYRGPGSTADVGGAGLGLAIASRLAMEQGGAVRHEDRDGGGSIFTLSLLAADVTL
jgi:two-component system sensor histidine kinase KdpD